MRVKHLIIGAGPTGLGAAHRLRELGEESFLVLERNAYAGGLAASFTDPAGFTWDVGGHVVFSHYPYFDRLLRDLLGAEYLEHQRVARVRLAGTWVPYPFQNNIRFLPPDMVWECVRGLLPEHRVPRPEGWRPAHFLEWIEHVFGPGIARVFMRPYNFKVWATPPELMNARWVGERVSVVDLERTLKNILLHQEDDSWGPNHTFLFPLHGGTGAIYAELARRLGDKVRLGAEVVGVDPAAREVRTADGAVFGYETLLSTAPLDLLVGQWLGPAPGLDLGVLAPAARGLAHSGAFIAGVGVEGLRPDPTCWMYFPEDNCPFYRTTNFHNYSPNNVARPGFQRGFMCETSFSPHKPEDQDALLEATIRGLVNTGLMDQEDRARLASTWSMAVDYGYPTPTLDRDERLAAVQPVLEGLGIYSRGRFGGWKYEVSNMDHSVMQGVEWAQRMVRGQAETTYCL